MIENVNNLVVHKYGNKDNIMTYKECREACEKEEECKAFDYYEDECRGVSVIGKPRLEEEGVENPDGRTFCTMEGAATDAAEEEEDETEEQDDEDDDEASLLEEGDNAEEELKE